MGKTPMTDDRADKNRFFDALRDDCVAEWLSDGGDPNDRRFRPLEIAVRHRRLRATQALLAAGGDPHLVIHGTACLPDTVTYRHANLLHVAMGLHRDECPEEESYVRLRIHSWPTPNPDLIRVLLNAGVSPSHRDQAGRTPLMRLLENAYPAREKVRAGHQDVASRQEDAERVRLGKVCRLLIRAQGDWHIGDQLGDYPIHVMTQKLAEADFRRLRLPSEAVHSTNPLGKTPLCLAVESLRPGIVAALLDAGAGETHPANRNPHQAPSSLYRRLSRDYQDANSRRCAHALFRAGVPIPHNLLETIAGHLLAYLRDHRDSDAPLPTEAEHAPEWVLPFLRRSESWWLREIARFPAPADIASSVFENPDCPDSIKDILRLSGL